MLNCWATSVPFGCFLNMFIFFKTCLFFSVKLVQDYQRNLEIHESRKNKVITICLLLLFGEGSLLPNQNMCMRLTQHQSHWMESLLGACVLQMSNYSPTLRLWSSESEREIWNLSFKLRGAWVAQSVNRLTLVQVKILGSWDGAWSQVPHSAASLFVPVPLPSSPPLFFSLSSKNKNKNNKKTPTIFSSQKLWSRQPTA